jgi:hypothetical protein
MRLARLICALPFVIAIGCGGDDDDNAGDDDGITLVDAAPPDGTPPPPPPDANSCVGNPNPDICAGNCVDFDTDEANCGGCNEPCNGGEYCGTGTCACPGSIVPAAPTFTQTGMQSFQGIDIGGGSYADPTDETIVDGLLVTKSAAGTQTAMAYPLSTSFLAPPTIAAVYNGNLAAQDYDSVFLATEGTVTFDVICAEGYSGHADNVTFQGATGELPFFTPDPNGCTFTVERIDFAIGTPADCPTE